MPEQGYEMMPYRLSKSFTLGIGTIDYREIGHILALFQFFSMRNTEPVIGGYG